jgi:hypothetical protein
LLHLTLTANTGRINEHVVFTIPFKGGINGVTGRTGNITDYDPVFPQQAVYQGGFADIRPANDSNLDDIRIFICLLLSWQEL